MMTHGGTGILGGTFDPIHFGHLDAAEAVRRALGLDQVMLLPSRTPPHRTSGPRASVFHRFAMAALAAADYNQTIVSDLELEHEGPSYTSWTLERLHATGLAASRLFFITGSDAFADIRTWRDYPRLLDLSHFAVVARPGAPLDDLRRQLPELAGRMRRPGEPEAHAQALSVFLVDAETRDVSSTMVRRRAAAGESLDGLVPPAVASHIRRHRLYIDQPLTA